MADLPPHYDDTTSTFPDELPNYSDSLSTSSPLQTYTLTRHSPKTASLNLTFSAIEPGTPISTFYQITYNPPSRPFAKPLPDIYIEHSMPTSSSLVASATFDSTTSNTTITYPSTPAAAETNIPLLLQSALIREYTTHIAGKPCLILPASRNDLLLVESRALQNVPWARFRSSTTSSPPSSSGPPSQKPSSNPKRSLLHRIKSKSRSPERDQEEKGRGEGQEVGVLEIFRGDLNETARDQVISVLVTVVERAQRMRVKAGKEKGHVACGYSCAAMMTIPA